MPAVDLRCTRAASYRSRVVSLRMALQSGTDRAGPALGIGTNGPVEALAVFDNGSGPALYAGGSFTTAGGAAGNHIAKWNGSSWSALGSGMSGMNSSVWALTVFNDGSGPALYAGGYFGTAGGVAANDIAQWNGSSWFALGSGMGVGNTTSWL